MRILVVGQGLAGTLVSHFALQKGWDCHVIDSNSPSASSVAAGMFNPMSFRRIIEVWDADAHLSAMTQAYSELEALVKTKLLHFMPIFKCIPNQQYADEWNRKCAELKWIDPIQNRIALGPGKHISHPQNTFGFGCVRGGGWVNLPLLITAWRSHLQNLNRYSSSAWTYNDLDETSLAWDAIVDCRGIATAQDSLGGERLDIRGNRGEILTVTSAKTSDQAKTDDFILNFGKWALPVESCTWRLGASYEWNRTDLNPTPATAEFLLDAAHKAMGRAERFELIQHDVGIRPVSKDRRPAVGELSAKHQLYTLNGLGTRGVLIAPRWAKLLIERISNKTQLPVNLQPKRLKIFS